MDGGKQCAVCGRTDQSLRCGRCKLVFYCSREHQRDHWRTHKTVCMLPLPLQTSTSGAAASSEPQLSLTKSVTTFESTASSEYLQHNSLCTAGPIAHQPQQQQRLEEVCRLVVRDMNAYGVCIVDRFLGEERACRVRDEVLAMHQLGHFQNGQLVGNRGDPKTVRGDEITWVSGREPSLPNIAYLIAWVDAVVKRVTVMEGNGLLGQYVINGRTKAMVACYPGGGAHYVLHVDNPHKDGRRITAIYYLNRPWDVKRDGGMLRIFPGGLHGANVAHVEPIFDRMLFFWSDHRNPHEVQKAFRTRYAITLWYFDAAEREAAIKRDLSTAAAGKGEGTAETAGSTATLSVTTTS